MQICVVGCGYLGAVHAAGMAELGHSVVGLDVDTARVATLSAGKAPFHEPGFAELLNRGLARGRLRFSADPTVLGAAELVFIAVGTPQSVGRNATDLRFLDAATVEIAEHAASDALIVGKSTVPVGTAARLEARLGQRTLLWNPEFLREGNAIDDTLRPRRIVYGLPDDPQRAERGTWLLDTCYRPLLDAGIPRLTTDYATAELAKVAANAFLATKISFINAMAELCDVSGADVTELAAAIGYDERIGPDYLKAGIGFGGGCLPKDIRGFMARAGELGVEGALTFLREVDAINRRARDRAVAQVRQLLGSELTDRRIAMLGAAFKPGSDDLRDSPSLDIAQRLGMLGAEVTITDPVALPALHRRGTRLRQCATVAETCQGAELVILGTDWDEYVGLDPVEVSVYVARPVVLDARNALDAAAWRAAGWEYYGMGRR